MSGTRDLGLRGSWAVALVWVLPTLPALAQQSRGETWLLRAGTVWSDGSGYRKNAGVLLRDGKIVAVDERIDVPAEARVVEVSQGFIVPGLVEAHTQTGLHGDGVGWDTDEDLRPITGDLHALDAFYPFAADVEAARCAGVTTLLVAPGGKNLIGGSGVILKTAGGFESVVRQPAVVKMSLGEEPKRETSAPKSRMGELALLREHMADTRRYEARRREAEQKGEVFEIEPQFELTASLLRREIPAMIQAYTAKDIWNALRLSRDEGFDLVLAYATEAHLMAAELADRDVPVVLTSMKGLWFRQEKDTFVEENASRLLAAGVRVAVQSGEGNPYGGAELLFSAGYLLKHGVTEEDALRSVTSWPSEILGIAQRVGRLEAGLDGDVVILSGPPFSPGSRVLHVFINGRPACDDGK